DRKVEINFLKNFTNHTHYGGELIGTYGLESPYESILEMNDVHLSYLNIAWNNNILLKLHNEFQYNDESLFTYILKYMGYRYIMCDANFSYNENDESLLLNISFQNNGFANLPYHHPKMITIIFYNDKNSSKVEKVAETSTKEIQKFTGETKELNAKIKMSDIPIGTYSVYLKFSNADGTYAIKLANKNTWSEDFKANKIARLEKKVTNN
ncbi:MAG: DUF4832 domain-containing protein, partial [Treponema sp.]|nr:DUF4832 domain-containing protein [Treponema sp.]